MEDTNYQKLISFASNWKIAIKQSKVKLTLALPIDICFEEKIKLQYFDLLSIQLNHLTMISTLAFHHQDHFDRLLIAQDPVEYTQILSRDAVFDADHIERIWD